MATVDSGFYPVLTAEGKQLCFAKERAFETSLWRMPASGDPGDSDDRWVLRFLDLGSGEIRLIRKLASPGDLGACLRAGPGSCPVRCR